MTQKIMPTHREIVMRDDDFIVTKTDKTGKLTYCNPIFIEFSGFSESELLGQQHNIIRHPDMPRAVFHLLWETVKSGRDFFGYVKNISKDGSFYWVYATVTPSYSPENNNEIIGFFSVRRKPDSRKLAVIQTLYNDMLIAEKSRDRHDAIAAGMHILDRAITETGKSYHEFILTL